MEVTHEYVNPSGNMYGQPVSGNHSDRMEIAAMTLGIISIVSCTCLYLAIPCGALAIILASLSRGGQMRYGAKAQVGLILGILGIVLTAVIYISAFAFTLHEYGSLEGILKAYSDMTGIDYNQLLQQ